MATQRALQQPLLAPQGPSGGLRRGAPGRWGALGKWGALGARLTPSALGCITAWGQCLGWHFAAHPLAGVQGAAPGLSQLLWKFMSDKDVPLGAAKSRGDAEEDVG